LAPSAARPNILIILADDQGYGDVGFNAVPSRQHIPGAAGAWAPNPPRTPNIDAWATDAASLVFTRAYSGSPVCSPTRASLLTGRSPDRECVFNAEGCGQQPAWSCVDPMPFPASVPTLARSLAGAGYDTMHFGKWREDTAMRASACIASAAASRLLAPSVVLC
jgi:arylsulfatase A-like enzyme